jgi:uncharacterized protein YbjT (DUF2867 family)
MKTALLVGASGATGQEILRSIESDNDFQTIHLLLRKSLGYQSHSRIIEHVINSVDFDQLNIDGNIDVVFCSLGTTMKKAGSKEAFYRVDHDLVLAAGRWAKQHNVSRFQVVSALGADKKSSSFYLKTKGEIEEALIALNFDQLSIYRPSLLHAKNRGEFRLLEALAYWPLSLAGLLPFTLTKRYKPVFVERLAATMIKNSGRVKSKVSIYESEMI